MANFLVVNPRLHAEAPGKRRFQRAVECAGLLERRSPAEVHETAWALAAVFPRANGRAAAIAVDKESDCFLLVAGTWFHSQGLSVGDEGALLKHFLEKDAGDVARSLDGFFCAVFGDARTRECTVITDLAGSHHAYVRETADGAVLSGSSLLLAGIETTGLDPVGCQEFLQTGVIYETRTCFEGIRKLPPASVHRYADGHAKSATRYWDATGIEPDSIRGDRATDVLWESLCGAAQRIGRIFPRVVCDLTGGYDSRAIAAALRGGDVPFTATVSGPPESADVRVSTALAARLGVPHLHTRPRMEAIGIAELDDALGVTDGEYDLLDYARIARTHRALMKQFDVSINGSYGELARGYWWELLFPVTGKRVPLDGRRLAALRYGALPFDRSLTPREGGVDLIAHLAGVVDRTNRELNGAPNTFQMDHAYLRMRMQRWQGRIASTTDRLWPCLSPFMFRGPLEVMLAADSRVRRRSLLIRRMLARYQPVMANFPLEHGYPAIPATPSTLWRFTPLAGHYAGRAWRKVRGKFGIGKRAAASGIPNRLILWREEPVREMLDPGRMRLSSLIDRNVLSDFLARSRQASFSFEDSWRRVLTLEWALRARERCTARDE